MVQRDQMDHKKAFLAATEIWKSMTDNEKKPYEVRAKNDQARFEREKNHFN